MYRITLDTDAAGFVYIGVYIAGMSLPRQSENDHELPTPGTVGVSRGHNSKLPFRLRLAKGLGAASFL